MISTGERNDCRSHIAVLVMVMAMAMVMAVEMMINIVILIGNGMVMVMANLIPEMSVCPMNEGFDSFMYVCVLIFYDSLDILIDITMTLRS